MKNSKHSSCYIILLFLFGFSHFYAQDLESIDFHLPIVIIDTNGESIEDEPKITAKLKIIFEEGQTSKYTDAPNVYDGFIGIEKRGNGSLSYQKPSYGFETRLENGENNNVEILGLPEENDWILYAAHIDKALMRNALTYRFVREMGHYASRTRHCELILNGEYRGIYVLMEKLKQDDKRIDVSRFKEGDNEDEGGYIFKVDAGWDENKGWQGDDIFVDEEGYEYWMRYQYVYPQKDEITDEQRAFIKDFMEVLDKRIFDINYSGSEELFQDWIDINSAIDLFLINEFTLNPDGFRLSTFMHYDPTKEPSKLYLGPAWDYNVGYSNYFERFGKFDDWDYDNHWWGVLDRIPFWWKRFMNDDIFLRGLIDRYKSLRQDILTSEWFNERIDSLSEHMDSAIERNFNLWTDDIILADLNWASTNTHHEDVELLKLWIPKRLAWMDNEIDILNKYVEFNEKKELYLYPNPLSTQFDFEFIHRARQVLSYQIWDFNGKIFRHTNFDSEIGINRVTVDARDFPKGCYVLSLFNGNEVVGTSKFIVYD